MKRLAEQTLYEILEMPPGAAVEELRAAIDRARAIYGPGSLATYTLMTPDEASFLFRRIEEAGVTLLDPEARARYDAHLLEAASSVANEGPAASPHATVPSPPVPLGSLPPVIPARPLGVEPARKVDDSPRGFKVAAVAGPTEEKGHGEGSGKGLPTENPPGGAEPLPESENSSRPALLLTPEAPKIVDESTSTSHATSAPPAPVNGKGAKGPAPRAPIRLERQVSVAFDPVNSFGEVAVWTGEMLRKVRESRGIPMQIIAERTKVTRHHLENIEADRYSLLPAAVYLRGILLGLARELRLDGQKVSRSYMEHMAAALASSSSEPKHS